jgi:hypothetical protein
MRLEIAVPVKVNEVHRISEPEEGQRENEGEKVEEIFQFV